MDFSSALIGIKLGHRFHREGWVPGQFVVLQDGYPNGIAINANTAKATGIPEGTTCAFQPYLLLYTQSGSFVPWVAPQSDLLAEDWVFEEVPQ